MMLLIPSVYGRPPGATGCTPEFAGKNIDIGGDSASMKIIDNDAAVLCHTKNRIRRFKFTFLITAAHHPDGRKSAISKVGDPSVIHEPWLYQQSSALGRLTQGLQDLIRASMLAIAAL